MITAATAITRVRSKRCTNPSDSGCRNTIIHPFSAITTPYDSAEIPCDVMSKGTDDITCMNTVVNTTVAAPNAMNSGSRYGAVASANDMWCVPPVRAGRVSGTRNRNNTAHASVVAASATKSSVKLTDDNTPAIIGAIAKPRLMTQ